MPIRIDRVDERERALERQRQRVERRDREEHDLDRVRALEVHVGVDLARVAPLAGRCAVMRQAATSTTIDHPMPMSSRFAPVMLASASGAYWSGSSPAFQANVKSTAYSGSTAISASTVSARPCDTSSWSTSAAQASRKAEPEDREPEDDGRHVVAGGWRPDEAGERAPGAWPGRPRPSRAAARARCSRPAS